MADGSYGISGQSLRERVFRLLDENGSLSPSHIGKLLGLTKSEYLLCRDNIYAYKYQWKNNHAAKARKVKDCPDEVHNGNYQGILPKEVVASIRSELALVLARTGNGWCYGLPIPRVGRGWNFSKAKNKYMRYKGTVGNIRLHDTGTVEIHVHKPVNDGRCMQLFAEAFMKTYLVTDIRVVEKFQTTLLRCFHGVFDTGVKVPYMKITAFEDTHGFIFASGDKSHPTCYEFMMQYRVEHRKYRELFETMMQFFEGMKAMQSSEGGSTQPQPLRDDYSR